MTTGKGKSKSNIVFRNMVVLSLILTLMLGALSIKSYASEDTAWQNEYEYTLDKKAKTITLTKFISTESTDVYVPVKAVIDGKEYSTLLYGTEYGGGISCFQNTNIKSIRVEEGVKLIDGTNYFAFFKNLESVDFSGLDTSETYEIYSMFWGCEALTSVDLSGFNTKYISNMFCMFRNCYSLTDLDLSGFDTSYVEDMSYIFSGCTSLKSLDISSFDMSKVSYKGAQDIFDYCDALEEIKTPKVLPSVSISLPAVFLDENGKEYSDLSKCPAKTLLKRKKSDESKASDESQKTFNAGEYGLSDEYVPDNYEDKSGSPMIIEGKNLSWNDEGGKSYWYENGIKQGTYYDPKGVLGTDPESGIATNRGREICDNMILDENGHGTWFWLDSVYDGAKAVGKEVWIPYIYQQEDEWENDQKREIADESDEGMRDLVYEYILGKKGKWVRYDEKGRMLKGWVTIECALAEKYPDQKGNRYYYDTRTGLMAKGKITIQGVEHFFDENTGVMKY